MSEESDADSGGGFGSQGVVAEGNRSESGLAGDLILLPRKIAFRADQKDSGGGIVGRVNSAKFGYCADEGGRFWLEAADQSERVFLGPAAEFLKGGDWVNRG